MIAAFAGLAAVCLAATHVGVALLFHREGRLTEHGRALDIAATYIAEWKQQQTQPYLTPPTLPTLDVLTRTGDAIQRTRWLDNDCAAPTTPLAPTTNSEQGVPTWR